MREGLLVKVLQVWWVEYGQMGHFNLRLPVWRLDHNYFPDKKVALDWKKRISDFAIEREIRKRIIHPQRGFQLRNPNPDFMDFFFAVRLRNPEKALQNYSREQRSSSFLLIMRARARPLFLRGQFFESSFGYPSRTVKRKLNNRYLSFEIRFRISYSIENPKSAF